MSHIHVHIHVVWVTGTNLVRSQMVTKSSLGNKKRNLVRKLKTQKSLGDKIVTWWELSHWSRLHRSLSKKLLKQDVCTPAAFTNGRFQTITSAALWKYRSFTKQNLRWFSPGMLWCHFALQFTLSPSDVYFIFFAKWFFHFSPFYLSPYIVTIWDLTIWDLTKFVPVTQIIWLIVYDSYICFMTQ